MSAIKMMWGWFVPPLSQLTKEVCMTKEVHERKSHRLKTPVELQMPDILPRVLQQLISTYLPANNPTSEQEVLEIIKKRNLLSYDFRGYNIKEILERHNEFNNRADALRDFVFEKKPSYNEPLKIENCVLVGQDLSGMDFRETSFGVNVLTDTNLDGVYLKDIATVEVILRNADQLPPLFHIKNKPYKVTSEDQALFKALKKSVAKIDQIKPLTDHASEVFDYDAELFRVHTLTVRFDERYIGKFLQISDTIPDKFYVGNRCYDKTQTLNAFFVKYKQKKNDFSCPIVILKGFLEFQRFYKTKSYWYKNIGDLLNNPHMQEQNLNEIFGNVEAHISYHKQTGNNLNGRKFYGSLETISIILGVDVTSQEFMILLKLSIQHFRQNNLRGNPIKYSFINDTAVALRFFGRSASTDSSESEVSERVIDDRKNTEIVQETVAFS